MENGKQLGGATRWIHGRVGFKAGMGTGMNRGAKVNAIKATMRLSTRGMRERDGEARGGGEGGEEGGGGRRRQEK
jgi:hypothetical protein